jgi:glycosyltransferase involved in cell wall biosynthesis
LFLCFYFKKSKEDIIYCAGGSWQIKAAIAGYLCKKKVIWHLNDTYVPKIVKIIFSHLSFMADGYVFASEASKSYYANTINDRHSIIIPSSVEEFPDNLLSKRIKFGDKDKIIIGTVCAINPTKNIEDFIELARVLESKQENKFEFRILGAVFDSQKNYYKKLKNLIKKYDLNNVFFLGETKEVNNFLNDFDFFVFTSKSESSPIVVKEAMIAGIPTLSYRVGDVDTYMINEYNGLLCNLFNIDCLAHWVEELSINNDLREKIAKNSYNFARKEFLYTKCANLHLKFFKEIASNS